MTKKTNKADYLGDRIAMMGNGELKCCGTSLFLKNLYGVGYSLVITKKPDFEPKIIERFIKSRVPEADIISCVKTEISFRLPVSLFFNYLIIITHGSKL